MQDRIYIGAQVPLQLKALIEKVSKSRGEDVSSFTRRSIKKELAALGFLPEEDMKALGIRSGGET